MAKIFVSYSRRDVDAANRLTAALAKAGHQVWIDRQDIQSGADWQETIVDAIRDAEYFVLLLSPESATSADVHKELTLADRQRKRILPVMLRSVDVPGSMQYALVNLQMIDLSQDFSGGIARLLGVLQHAVAAAPGHVEAGSGLLRNATTGTSTDRGFAIRLGALSWGAGCCLGALLAAAISRGHIGALSLVAWTTFIGAVFGAVFGSIFKRRVMDNVLIVSPSVFGMMALMLGLLLFFLFGLGLEFEDTFVAMGWTVGPVLGWGLWIAMKLWTKRTFVEQIKKTGRTLATQYKGVAENSSYTWNGISPMRIVSQWHDPATNQVHLFYSKNLWFDPSEFIQMNVITVYVDPTNFGNYHMDTSFLPKVEK